MAIIKNQEAFFNAYARADKPKIDKDNLFYKFTNKEIVHGLLRLKDSKSVLEYGCGIGDVEGTHFVR